MDDEDHRPRPRSRHRPMLLLAGIAVAIVLAVGVVALGAGGPGSGATQVAAGPRRVDARDDPSPTTPSGVDPREVTAQAEARALLAAVPIDPTWTATPSTPLAILAQPADRPATDHLVDLTRFFTTPTAWDAVDAWLAAHPPVGLESAGTGSSGDRTGPTSRTLMYAVPPLPPTTDHFQAVEITTAPLPGGGTALRVDAGAIWSPTRPPDEMVPAGVDTALITVTRDQSVIASQTVHDAAVVHALVDTVDHLPVAVGGPAYSCPAQPGATFAVTFTGVGGALATVASGNCGPSTFTRGHGPALMLETEDLMDQEAKVLGTSVGALDSEADQAAIHPVPRYPVSTPPG